MGERKERAMVERQEEQNNATITSSSGGGGGRSGDAAFKKEKKKKYTEQKTPTNQVTPTTLRRESGSSGSEPVDNEENEIPMPLCWADDEPLDQTVIDDITKAVPGLK